MGSWFSNLHIRKHETGTVEALTACLQEMMGRRGYTPVASEQDADATIAMISRPDSQWITLCADALAHDDSESCGKLALPISSALHTDVLGIACFDSDYLYLNLFNADEQLDAWVGIGSGRDVGIERRTAVTAWKKKVSDYSTFSAGAKAKYPCAEAFLEQAGPCLGLPLTQSMASQKEVTQVGEPCYLYFRFQEDARAQLLPRLAMHSMDSKIPCLVGRQSEMMILSVGAGAYGLSVYFLGPGVEEGTLHFSDVCLGRNGRCVPIAVEKIQLPDGRWAYGYHDPSFPIPDAPPKRLKWEKRWQIMVDQRIELQFIPWGDPRKTLDITVLITPDQNPVEGIEWNVLRPFGSKKAFIEHHNKIWRRVRAFETDPDSCMPLLKESDFD